MDIDGPCEDAELCRPQDDCWHGGYKVKTCRGIRTVKWVKTMKGNKAQQRPTPESAGVKANQVWSCKGWASGDWGVHKARYISCNAKTPTEATYNNMWTPTGHTYGCYYDCSLCKEAWASVSAGIVS